MGFEPTFLDLQSNALNQLGYGALKGFYKPFLETFGTDSGNQKFPCVSTLIRNSILNVFAHLPLHQVRSINFNFEAVVTENASNRNVSNIGLELFGHRIFLHDLPVTQNIPKCIFYDLSNKIFLEILLASSCLILSLHLEM